jgi:uncharacterized phage-associated protein
MTVPTNKVADYFLTAQDPDAGELLTHLKLQKLVYYAEAWSLVLRDESLVSDQFEAWVHGPAIRGLYARFADHGCNPIGPDAAASDPSTLPEDVQELLDEVWEVYGQFSAKKLELLTHSEKPWIEAREGCRPLEKSSRSISKRTMKEYYLSLYEDAGQKEER